MGGEFSEIVGPFTIKPKQPEQLEPLEILMAGERICKLLLKLPYNMGSPIHKASVMLSRINGPLAAEEVHPETGECKSHIATREIEFNPLHLPIFSPLGPGPREGRWVSGTTEALLQAHRDEEASEDTIMWSGHLPTLTHATGRAYVVTLEDLQPGSRYTVRWFCENDFGSASYPDFTDFSTGAT